MGDFFYYGQKDTIQRLNELAGRGAVVASYAAAVGRSPLGGPNGYMSPAWLDPGIPIATAFPVAVGITNKYGYSYVGQNPPTGIWYRIATFAADGGSNAQHLRIDGVVNSDWAASASTPFVLMLGVRNGFYYDATFNGAVSINARIQVFQQVNGTFEVYLHFRAGTFGSASFSLLGYTTTTYAQPVSVTATPAGAVVYDSGNAAVYPPRMRGISNSGTYAGLHSAVQVNNGLFFGDWTTGGGYIRPCSAGAAAGVVNDVLSLGVGGLAGSYSTGQFVWYVSGGANSLAGKEGFRLILRAYDKNSNTTSADLARFQGNGQVYVPLLKAGSTNTGLQHSISRGAAEGDPILYVGTDAAAYPSVWVVASNGQAGWSFSPAVLTVGKNSTTSRSINVTGTVNTNGNDYAEYIFKSSMCGIVAPGQIVGITAENKVTDMWADAVMFSIKSTAPSFVGGDTWGHEVGPRPSAQAGVAPTRPVRRADVVTSQAVPGIEPPEFEDVIAEPGDTDDEWAAKQAIYAAALAAHNTAVLQDAEAMAAFDAALEVERQKVDRIAIAGRVPVNVLGTQPGDYIVPVQDGAGIKGIAVHEDDLSMKQYLHAVGRVISAEPDGRAYVMVKAV
ncbi:hypothetical protein O0881_05805 [Janthinobacterium sp. SUN100]|uniref:hypothetical protein n=1 Tax=Janthinobacterium sp. SUN100 TaxID=3004101 RepID=UPI0025AEF4FB|nr:hypothetical protein [Janthinobacterium sp. SUN100]MDN2701512.1 hypothetical protein [Janthinobacterium sp. SUN100]